MSKHVKQQTEAIENQLKQLEEMRRRLWASAKPDDSFASPACISDLIERYPSLHLAMMAGQLPNGPEEGATIILWGKPDGLGGILNMKPMGVKAFIDAGSLAEWLQTAEDMLNDPQAKWHREKPANRSRKRNKGYGSHRG